MVLHWMGLDIPLTPGSLRAGGATFFFLQMQNALQLKELGRWKTDSSLQIYIQEAVATLVWSQLPRNLESTLLSIIMESEFAWNQAPKAPWIKLFQRSALNMMPKSRA